MSESRDASLPPSTHGESGRMARRDSSASVEDSGMDDGGNADEYGSAPGWDDPNSKVGHLYVFLVHFVCTFRSRDQRKFISLLCNPVSTNLIVSYPQHTTS